MAEESEVKDLDRELLGRMLQDFLKEAPEHLDQLNLKLIQLEEDPQDEGIVDEVFRIAHTLKGSAAFVGLDRMSRVSHKMQDIMGAVRKGSFKLTAPIIDTMYDALDVLTALMNEAGADESQALDVSQILGRLDMLLETPSRGPEEEVHDDEEREPLGSQELLAIYKESYDQLAALKHIVYSSVHLSEPESLAVLFSKQINERMSAEGNAVWLVRDGEEVMETARNGEPVPAEDRRTLDIESSEIVRRIIREQLVIWSSGSREVQELLPDFKRPVLFPIKTQPEALGFLVVDPEEIAEVEVYQFIGQFAAMILNISRLHEKVQEQRRELNEMTEILFKQNAQLASIYHVEMDLMKVTTPESLCRIVVETVVRELEARRAAAFLMAESSQELIGISESGGLEEIDGMRIPLGSEKPIRESIESGRVITYKDHPEPLRLGANVLGNWAIISFKGRTRPRGILVTEFGDEDIGDAVSILVNHAGILLDCLMLQEGMEDTVTVAQG